jgi:hypothetical protein
VSIAPSPNRRGIQVVFYGLCGAFFVIAMVPLLDHLRDSESRSLLLRHDWSNRGFRELASTFAIVMPLAGVFLFCAILTKNAGMKGLFLLASINAVLLAGSLFDAGSFILAFPLCLSFIGLLVEIYRARRTPGSNPA